jgi:hypothetical protein
MPNPHAMLIIEGKKVNLSESGLILQHLVDKFGLDNVVYELAQVCYAEESDQLDKDQAKQWAKCGSKLEKLTSNPAVKWVSL